MYRHLLYLCLVTFPLHVEAQEDKVVDSLRDKLSEVTDNENKISLNFALYQNLKYEDSDAAGMHLDKAAKLSAFSISDSLKGKISVSQVERYLLENQYDGVFHYVEKSLGYKEVLAPKLLVDLYSMLGTAHYYKSEYAKAVKAHRVAEDISRENGFDEGLARVFNNIGITYIKMENWQLAKTYITNSFNLCKKYDLGRGMAFTLGNLGIINKNQGNFNAAIAAYLESNMLLEKERDTRGLARNYDNIGALYEQIENFSLAETFYFKSLRTATEIDDQSTMTSALHNLGSLYHKQGRLKASISNYEKSLSIAEKLDNKDVIRDNHLGLSKVFEDKGESNRALHHYKQFSNWKDSITNEEHLKNVSELEIKYESEKKENDILVLSQQKLSADTKLLEQRTKIRFLSYGLVGAILVLGIVMLLIIQYNKNRKHRELIETIAEAQIAERNRIARDLHDSIGGSLALAKNNLQSIQEKTGLSNVGLEDAIKTIAQTAEQVRQISHNLMPGELVKFGLVPAIQTILHELEGTNLKTELYAHNMEERMDMAKEIHLFRIIQESVQNVIKHAGAKSIQVFLNKHPKHISLMVEDNGRGMDVGKIPNGMGLDNINSRVAQFEGKFNIDSTLGKGTTLSIQIPL